MGMFTRAIREQLKLRMALVGPSGSGKTLTALKIAKGLAGDTGKIAVIDTERGSARRYANLMEFYVVELDHYSPDSYIKAIKAAEVEGFTVLVIDSLSHAWNKKGGILEMVDKTAKASKGGNTFAAWAEATPKHNALIDAILDASMHVIVTMRVKHEWLVETNERGKVAPKKVGTAPVQRDDLEYEFDITADMDLEHNFTVSKSRCMALDGQTLVKPDESLGATLKAWADEGIEPMARPQTMQPASESHWSEDPIKMGTWVETVAEKVFGVERPNGVRGRSLELLGKSDFKDYPRGQDAFTAVQDAYNAIYLPPAQPKNGTGSTPEAPVEPETPIAAQPPPADVDLDAHFAKTADEKPALPDSNPFKGQLFDCIFVPRALLSANDVVKLSIEQGAPNETWTIKSISQIQNVKNKPCRKAVLINDERSTDYNFDGIGVAPNVVVVGGPKFEAALKDRTLVRKNEYQQYVWLSEDDKATVEGAK